LETVIRITSTRETGDKTETNTGLYISSLDSKNDFNRFIRDHWAAENNLHRRLDTVFREDGQRKRVKHTAENFATVRKIALNLLRKNTQKGTLKLS
jgi:predicted transposase YbfD/YdcC